MARITIPNQLWVKPLNSQDSEFVELTNYIKLGGIKWSRNDVEASTAGRTQDGYMHRARVAIKIRLDVSCIPLYAEDMKTVLQAIRPVRLTVRYFDPQEGHFIDKNMYSNNLSAQFLKMNTDNTSYWEGLEFPLIEL